MATQNNEPLTAISSRASLVDDPEGDALSKQKQDKRSRRRACPIIALLGLLVHLTISVSGAAVSVLVVHFNLQAFSAGIFDLVARVLLFVASCMSIFYVLMHAFAARENYIRSHGSPQIFGYFTVAVAVLVMRLGVPVWLGSVALTAVVAAMKGFSIVEGLKGNIVWIQLAISSLGLSTINTPESPDLVTADNQEDTIRPLVRVRSQLIPTPLEAVFTSGDPPLDAEDSPRKLAWHPRRESRHIPQRPQIATVPASARLTSIPRQPSSASPRASSPQPSSIHTLSRPEQDETSTASDPDTAMPPSPGLGTPIEFPTSEPLRIVNPDDEDPVQPQEPPTLAKLLGQLSTRAAARRRNSLLVRQAEAKVSPAADEDTTRAASRTDMAAVLFDQPGDYIGEAPEDPVQRRNSLLVRQADLDVRRSISVSRTGEVSVFSLDTSTEFVEIPRPPETARRAMTAVEDEQSSGPPRLVRSATTEPLLVRNFSRPGAPRPRTAGGEEDATVDRGSSEERRGRDDIREEKQMARRSRSLPPARQNRGATAGDESRFKRNKTMSGRKKGSQPPATPRFSPFPKAPVATPPLELGKVKGLGQGSTRRRDARIERWMDEVPVGQG
ncbi:hypothetical protein N0V82_010053 [Gnomoniopsis sp. IMI 355080]|nr:hypothetical protein N0V82_010053 [Gnomoniopsis sp. IMI 355080]